MGYVTTRDGESLFFKDWGEGDRTAVFIHGGGVGSDMWDYQMTHLALNGVRCVAYDRRGCGRSGQPGGGYDYDTMADDLAAVLETLDLRDVTLISHSMGSGEVARYLARHGAARVRDAVIIGGTTPYLLRTDDNPEGLDGAVRDAMIAAVTADRPAYTASIAGAFFGVGLPGVEVSPETVQWGINLALQSPLLPTIKMMHALWETDFRADLRSLPVPALVIHGLADASAPFEVTGRRTAALIPDCRLETYETGHGLFFTEKDRLNRDLLRFIRPAS